MISSTLLAILYPMFTLIAQATAQQMYLYHSCFNLRGNYTTNSTYEANLSLVLYSISSNTQVETAFTLTLRAKTLTKFMQLVFVEEILSKMIVLVASRTLRVFSHNSAQIRRRQ